MAHEGISGVSTPKTHSFSDADLSTRKAVFDGRSCELGKEPATTLQDSSRTPVVEQKLIDTSLSSRNISQPEANEKQSVNFEGDTFDIKEEMKEIMASDVGTDYEQEQELAKRLNNIIFPNPTGIEVDGNCIACAFNACMAFAGYPCEEATHDITKFNAFYEKHMDDLYGEGVAPEEGDTLDQFRARVEEEVKSMTIKGESVMLAISEGAHWIAGYNDGDRVWFVDAQPKGGRGFNLYTQGISEDDTINICKFSPGELSEAYDKGWWK